MNLQACTPPRTSGAPPVLLTTSECPHQSCVTWGLALKELPRGGQEASPSVLFLLHGEPSSVSGHRTRMDRQQRLWDGALAPRNCPQGQGHSTQQSFPDAARLCAELSQAFPRSGAESGLRQLWEVWGVGLSANTEPRLPVGGCCSVPAGSLWGAPRRTCPDRRAALSILDKLGPVSRY